LNKMRILFLSYWGVHEGLTSATVIPHLRILSEMSVIEKIIFCSIEREKELHEQKSLGIPKLIHIPLQSKSLSNVFLTKFSDFYQFTRRVEKLCSEYSINKLVCRSPLAGAIGYLVWKRTQIPFTVESFEPHGIGMLESGVWKRYDPRFLLEQYFEKKQKQKSEYISPVSHHYERQLIKEGIDQKKIITMPCCVPLQNFKFNKAARDVMRTQLKFSDKNVVGIYVGKFGSIYYDKEAFELFRYAFDFFGTSFRLIILSGDDRSRILHKLEQVGIDLKNIIVYKAPHEEVVDYLSAADFAFSTIKPVPSRLFCSPIKNGEYWANGLPILTERGIGDDSDIIIAENGGVILNLKEMENSFKKLRDLLECGREKLAPAMTAIAFRNRRMEIIEQAYHKIFNG
jgi:hypothetical protein